MPVRFAPVIKSVRLRMRCTQRQFAELLGVPPSTYKSWEYRRCHPSLEHLDLLSYRLKNHEREIEAAYLADKLE